MTENDVNRAAERRAAALERLAEATGNLALAKANLLFEENALVLAGLEGANERARAARLYDGTEHERGVVAAAEAQVRIARLALDLADNELARLRLLLHLRLGNPADQEPP